MPTRSRATSSALRASARTSVTGSGTASASRSTKRRGWRRNRRTCSSRDTSSRSSPVCTCRVSAVCGSRIWPSCVRTGWRCSRTSPRNSRWLANLIRVPPVSTNEFRNGMHIALEGQTWRIVEFQHVKPGKGGAFVRTKMKSIDSGSVVDKTFRAGEKFERVFTENKNMQYLYDAGDEVVFMDEETFEQMSLAHPTLEEELPFMQPSTSVQLLFVGGEPSGVQLPSSVELEVTETEPGVKGDTVSNVTKPATVETGAVVQVPLFVNVGDRIKVDPRERRYISRA